MRGRGRATGCDDVRVRRRGCRPLSTALLLLLVASACGDGAAEPDARPGYDAIPIDAIPLPIPRVEPAECRFDVPDGLGVTEGTDYECGDLVVYEDHDAATGRTVKVHYIRFFSPATSVNATIYLDGGPGGDGNVLPLFEDMMGTETLRSLLDGLLVDGDFLIIGQRGTNLSEPALLSSDPSDLLEIADLSSYNTAYNADDVDDLRCTLGYDQLNLYGLSYGSRLGLEVMRRHGDHLRASVIGGLCPPQLNYFAVQPKGLYSAVTALDAACANAGNCGSTYGDLAAKLVTGVESLNDESLTFHEGFADWVILNGGEFARLLVGVLHAPATYPKLPMVISDVAERRTDRVGETIAAWHAAQGGDGGVFAHGMYLSVACSEQFNPPDESAFDEINADVPASLRAVFAPGWDQLLDTCASWPVGVPRPELSQPVTSAVRTLVSSGAMDPITPPSSGDLVAATLSDHEVVVFPASSHGATLQSPCGRQTLLAFLSDPDQPLDTSCADSLSLDFELPSTRRPWTADDQARLVSELRHAPIRPLIRE